MKFFSLRELETTMHQKYNLKNCFLNHSSTALLRFILWLLLFHLAKVKFHWPSSFNSSFSAKSTCYFIKKRKGSKRTYHGQTWSADDFTWSTFSSTWPYIDYRNFLKKAKDIIKWAQKDMDQSSFIYSSTIRSGEKYDSFQKNRRSKH